MKFYKAFEEENMLVQLTTDSEGEPCIQFSTFVEGVGVVNVHHTYKTPMDCLKGIEVITVEDCRAVLANALADISESLKGTTH